MVISGKRIKFLSTIIIVYSLVPLVSRAWSTYLTTYSYMLLVLLAMAYIILARGHNILNHYVLVLLPFVGWCILQYFVRKDSIGMYGYQQLLFILPVAVGMYLYEEGDMEHEAMLHKIILFCLCVTAITTIIGLYRFPVAARWLATADSSSDSQLTQYNWMNIGGFDFIYTLLLIYPLIVLWYKKKKIKTVTFILLAALIVVTLYEAEYTTAILLFLISSALLFSKRDLRGKELMVLVTIAVVICIFLSDYVSDFMSWLGNVLGGDNYTERFNALAGGTQGLMASEDDRIFRYMRSWNTFLSHPLLGTFLSGGGGIGGHSFILDALGQFGLLGGVLLFFMYKRIYEIFYQPYCGCEGYGYMLWAFMQTVFLSAINTGMWLMILCLYIPILGRTIFHVGEREDMNEDIVDY